MNPQSQGINSSPAEPPLKRKRGRPRKDESLVQGENMPATPVADIIKKNKQCAGTVSDEMVGQVVSGVIEGSFDAGYLLKVKVGDSDTHLRGVVFLPGRFTPITASNDVAPQVKMYRRTDLPVPALNPTQVLGPVPSSQQSDKQPVELQNQSAELENLAPIVEVQGLSSELQSSIPTAPNQSASCVLPWTDNLPISSTGSSFGGIVAPQQILESGLGSQSTSVMPQILHDKVAQQDEFEASITTMPNINKDGTEQSKSVRQSAPSVDSFPNTTGSVNLGLKIQHQAAGNEFKPSQSIDGGVKSPNSEHNQVPVITEPAIMSAESVGINIGTEKQASLKKAAPPEVAMNIISGNDAPHMNGNPATDAANVTESDSKSAPTTALPAMLFEREAISSAPKLGSEGSLQKMIEPQLCSSSVATSIMKVDSNSAPVTSLPVTVFEREDIPSEPKLVSAGPVLPRMTEPLSCSSSGMTNNVDCNLKDAIPPTES